MSELAPATIQLTNFVTTKLDFYIPPGMTAIPMADIEVRHRVVYESSDSKTFLVYINVAVIPPADKGLVSEQESLRLKAEFAAMFETHVSIDDAFKASAIPNLNAVVIAFPFVRSFLASFTSTAGIPRLIIPAINFRLSSIYPIKRQDDMGQATKSDESNPASDITAK